MNKYLIPIAEVSLVPSSCWVEVITARSNEDCQSKLMQSLIDKFDLPTVDDYKEFVREADKYDIIIGDIIDIEEL